MIKSAWEEFVKAFSFDYTTTDQSSSSIEESCPNTTATSDETPVVISIHPLTHDPTAAWKEISKTQRFIKISAKSPEGKVPANKVRVVCMSDTHSLTNFIPYEVPDGDIFIHAGDFTNCGEVKDVIKFNDWLGTLPHKHKIVIAGNHEISFDNSFTHPLSSFQDKNVAPKSTKHASGALIDKKSAAEQTSETDDAQSIGKLLLTNCTYIEDELIEVCGLLIYGSPWQPEFGSWAFNLKRGEACLQKWNNIPQNIDILITHGPPLGHGDLCRQGIRAGCVELLTTVQQRVKPKYHVFGHIHEDYGISSDGRIIYINASTCNIKYKPCNPAVVFDVALPPGATK